MAVTTHKMYQFTGVPSFKDLFKKYSDDSYVLEAACKIFPFSSTLKKSQLQLLFNSDDKPSSFGWKSESGFCCGDFNEGQVTVQKFTVTPYEKIKKDGKKEKDNYPISIAHSSYHIFFLFYDCLTIVSKITSNIIHTEYLKEPFLDMEYDSFSNSIWFCTSAHLYQMQLAEEDKNVWQDYLEKGQYKNASDFSKERKQDVSKKISRIAANSAFEIQDYQNAAVQYSESDEKFEEVGLKFLVNDQYDPLMTYLMLISETRLKKTEKTQMCLISTWMVEIYLYQINSLKLADDIKKKSQELIDFLKEKEEFLDKDTIYQLLQQYGRVDEFIQFAENKKDYETVILHYINDKKINEAINKLREFAHNSPEDKIADLSHIFTRYTHIFMKHNTEATIELLKDQKNKIKIDSNRLISAMMNTDKGKRDKVVNYLKTLIDDSKNKDKNLHNLYIFFLANLTDVHKKTELIEYLKKHLSIEKQNQYSGGSVKEIPFETEYALKVFSRTQNFPAQAIVLAMIGKYSEAVKISLAHKEVETAKFIAKSIEDPKVKKVLWLDIFKDQIKRPDTSENSDKNNQNFQNSLNIMKESEVLKIEDVLPHIVDNIRIEEFKEQISNCINVYEENIQKLKKEISSYNDTAENIKSDIYKVKKKSIEIQYKRCLCDVCNCNIKDNNIYLFPCGHMFDTNCILESLNNYAKYLDIAKIKNAKITELKAKIDDLERRKEESRINAESNKGERNIFTGIMILLTDKDKRVDKITITADELNKLEELKASLSDLLSEECVLCGNMMIESTQQGFTGDKGSWIIV